MRLKLLGQTDGVWRSLYNTHMEKMSGGNMKVLMGKETLASKPRGKKRAMKEVAKLGAKKFKKVS